MRQRLLPLLLILFAAVGVTTAVAKKGSPSKAGTPTSYTIPGEKVFPEGIARQPGSRAFFVTSTTDGTIFRGDLRRPTLKPFAAPGADGRTTAIGLKADNRRNLVVAGGDTGKVFVLSTRDGSTRKVLDSRPGTAPTFLNDVALARGYAYVTDSQRPILQRVKLGKNTIGELETFVSFEGTELEYEDGFNLNGIVAGPGGTYLLAVQSNTGELFRIDTKTKRVEEVDLGGKTLTNGDGLLRKGNTLYVARNQQELIVPVKLSRKGRSGLVGRGVTGPQLKYPTTLARDGKRLLAVNSQFDKRSAGEAPVLPFDVATLTAPKVKKGKQVKAGKAKPAK